MMGRRKRGNLCTIVVAVFGFLVPVSSLGQTNQCADFHTTDQGDLYLQTVATESR